MRGNGLFEHRDGLLNSLSRGAAERDVSSGSPFKFPGVGGWDKRSNFELETALPTGDGNTTKSRHSARVLQVHKGLDEECRTIQNAQDPNRNLRHLTDSKNQEHFTGYKPDQSCRVPALNFTAEPKTCIPPWAGGVCSYSQLKFRIGTQCRATTSPVTRTHNLCCAQQPPHSCCEAHNLQLFALHNNRGAPTKKKQR